MIARTSPRNESIIQRRIEQTRNAWPVEERERRAELGRCRRKQLLELIDHAQAAEAVWAVGAPGIDDWRRIAG